MYLGERILLIVATCTLWLSACATNPSFYYDVEPGSKYPVLSEQAKFYSEKKRSAFTTASKLLGRGEEVTFLGGTQLQFAVELADGTKGFLSPRDIAVAQPWPTSGKSQRAEEPQEWVQGSGGALEQPHPLVLVAETQEVQSSQPVAKKREIKPQPTIWKKDKLKNIDLSEAEEGAGMWAPQDPALVEKREQEKLSLSKGSTAQSIQEAENILDEPVSNSNQAVTPEQSVLAPNLPKLHEASLDDLELLPDAVE